MWTANQTDLEVVRLGRPRAKLKLRKMGFRNTMLVRVISGCIWREKGDETNDYLLRQQIQEKTEFYMYLRFRSVSECSLTAVIVSKNVLIL